MCIFSELMENEAFNQEASLASGFNSTDFSLSNFTYMNNVIQTMMLEQLSQTDFTGVTVSLLMNTLNER